jgi:hypothetical protein
MSEAQQWYVVKQADGHCQILTQGELEENQQNNPPSIAQWGPFSSEGEAIARRVGLIRAGKCQPN